MNLTSENKNVTANFDESKLTVNIFTKGINVCLGGVQQLLVRTTDAVFVPNLLNNVEMGKFLRGKINFNAYDDEYQNKAGVSVAATSRGLKFTANIKSAKPVWLFEWKLNGLDFDEVIIPALGGQAISKNITDGTTLSYKYPFWWNAQFVIGRFKNGGIILRTEDKSTNLKLLRIGKENGKFSFSVGFEGKAPIKNKTMKCEWFLEHYEGDWKSGVDIHRVWMEKVFNLVAINEHKHFPSWGNEIKFILEVWGARKDEEKPMHSFAQIIERMHEWKKLFDPKKTLLYLPGFAEHGIDSNAPSYNPSKQCGGDKEFKRLVDEAHKLGFKVMIHTNVLAMTFTHPLYKKFKKYQVVDVFKRPQGWAMDMDGDWLTEPYFAYMNPGFNEWGNLMSKILGQLIKKFELDAVFLDQTLLAFNVSKGPDFITGMKKHIQRLQKDFPNVLFAGEGLHEQNVEVLPMAQIHGIDSIAEVHGMEGQTNWRAAHPVSSYLFGKYTKYTAHLLTKHPSHPMFKLQEEAYKKLNVVPALCLYNSEQKMNLPEVKEMIARAKK